MFWSAFFGDGHSKGRCRIRYPVLMALVVWSIAPAALAQTASSGADDGTTAAETPPSPGPNAAIRDTGPIVNGKHLQPRGQPNTIGSREADHVLQQGAHSPATQRPPVIPRDLYGEPMGPSPGLAPPDPDPHRQAGQNAP